MKIKFILAMLVLCFFQARVMAWETPLHQTSFEMMGDLVWNKWETDNFIVLSLDKSQGLSIRESVEDMRSSFLDSWGLSDAKSLLPCKLICVPDKETLNKLFGINEPRYEVRYDSDGKATSCSVWLDYDNVESLNLLVGSASVSRSVFPSKMNPALRKGILALGRSAQQSRELLRTPSTVDPKSIFSIADDTTQTKEATEADRNCALVCLLLRKEFGRHAFSSFANGSQDEDSLKRTFGFSGYEEFAKTLSRFSKNLSDDISNRRTPDEYLTPIE